MPTLWSYLIKSYLEVFFLCVAAFISILLISRLEDIAHFTSFGANGKLILLFTLLQIPYILPIAIPIGCLIASILLMQRLSLNHELTSLRSAGFSLKEIIAPLLIVSTFIAMLNFYTVSELATFSHLKTNLLKTEIRSINPLLLLHNKHLMRLKGFFVDIMGASKMGQTASDIIIAVPHDPGLNLIFAKRLEIVGEELNAKNLSVLTSLHPHTPFSNLLFETNQSSIFSIEDFSELIQKNISAITPDSLNMNSLLLKIEEDHQKLLESNEVEIKNTQRSIRLAYSEIARRISAGLSPLSFTLLGLAFGMSLSREKKGFQLTFPIGFAALYLFCFFAAKSLAAQTFLTYILYLIPHGLIISASTYKMYKVSHGIA